MKTYSHSGSVHLPQPIKLMREEINMLRDLMLFMGMFLVVALINNAAYAIPGLGGDHGVNCAITHVTIRPGGGINGGGGVNPVCTLFSVVYQAMEGLTGRALATLAIMAVGAAALFGKVSWPTALITAFGVGLVFGAGSLLAPIGTSFKLNIGFYGINDPIGATLVVLAGAMQGESGRAVGIVACVIIGIGALFGKVTWLQCLLWVVGIGMVYGAVDLVTNLFVNNGNASDAGVMYVLATQADKNGIIDPVAVPFMNIIVMFLSSTGIAIGTVGVLACGFAALIGKLTWPRAMMLGAGIALMYGAADVVYILMGPLTPCAVTTPVSDPFTQVLCGFMQELQGPAGQTIGTLAIMILGVLAVMGKISWEMGFVVTTGIALIFGANAIVELFESSTKGTSCAAGPTTPPSTGNAIADVLCYIIVILYGPAGKALATIAVTMMGFGALMGKVSFSQAFVVAVGIAVTFGAPNIVQKLMPNAATNGCNPGGSVFTGTGGLPFGGGYGYPGAGC